MPIPLVNNNHKYTLYYDAHCLLCSKAMQFIRKIDSQRRILILPNTQLPANYSFVKETVVFVADNRSVYYFTFYGLKQRIPVLGILVGKTTVPYIYRTFSHLILQHNNRVLT